MFTNVLPVIDDGYRLVNPRKQVTAQKLDAGLRNHLAAVLATRLSPIHVPSPAISVTKQLLNHSSIESWGRLRRIDWGDTMLASETVDASAEDRPCAPYVRVRGLVPNHYMLLTGPHPIYSLTVLSILSLQSSTNATSDENTLSLIFTITRNSQKRMSSTQQQSQLSLGGSSGVENGQLLIEVVA